MWYSNEVTRQAAVSRPDFRLLQLNVRRGFVLGMQWTRQQTDGWQIVLCPQENACCSARRECDKNEHLSSGMSRLTGSKQTALFINKHCYSFVPSRNSLARQSTVQGCR